MEFRRVLFRSHVEDRDPWPECDAAARWRCLAERRRAQGCDRAHAQGRRTVIRSAMEKRRLRAAFSLVRLFRAWHVVHVSAWRSEEHTSELQSLMRISYAVFCLNKKNQTFQKTTH